MSNNDPDRPGLAMNHDEPSEPGEWGPPFLVPIPGGESKTVVSPDLEAEAADTLSNLFRELYDACGVKWTDGHRQRVERVIRHTIESSWLG